MRRLLIRPGAIGDCILSLPALEHLKADQTEIWISSPVVPLIQFADVVHPLSVTGIDRIALGDEPIERQMKQRLQSFDSIVSWYGSNRPEFRAALESLGIPCVFHRALSPPDFDGHATDFFAHQVGAPAGLVPRIRVDQTTKRGTVVIHPFSGGRKKNWPLEKYRELAAQLHRAVDWIAGPEEELEGAHRFARLDELASWLAGADLFIGNDSGITHLAAASGVRTLALFGPTDPAVWGPRGENARVLQYQPLDALPVHTVATAVDQIQFSLEQSFTKLAQTAKTP